MHVRIANINHIGWIAGLQYTVQTKRSGTQERKGETPLFAVFGL